MEREYPPTQHFIRSQQVSREFLEKDLFPEARRMEVVLDRQGYAGVLNGKSVCLLFYEPSTRTRVSFEQAAHKLGMYTSATENAKDFSSAIKGESIKDTIRVVNSLQFDAVVMRHYQEGAAEEAAEVSKIPVINAGDGPGQHPTQAVLDIYTAKQHFDELDGLHVSFVGDLKNGRTVHSAAYLLSKFNNVEFDFVAPEAFQMKPEILEYLDRHDVKYQQHARLIDVAHQADVIYLTRIQSERLANGSNGTGVADYLPDKPYEPKPLPVHQDTAVEMMGADDVKLTDEVLDKMRPNSIVMHPLPRIESFGELPERYTQDPRVVIFDQVKNGLYTRMALLKIMIEAKKSVRVWEGIGRL